MIPNIDDRRLMKDSNFRISCDLRLKLFMFGSFWLKIIDKISKTEYNKETKLMRRVLKKWNKDRRFNRLEAAFFEHCMLEDFELWLWGLASVVEGLRVLCHIE